MKRFLLTMMILLIAVPSMATTIAWWDFEDGVAGQFFTPEGQPNGSAGSYDIVNNYLMRGWNIENGPSWSDVTPTGEGLSMYCDGNQDGYVIAEDGADLVAWTPTEWTLEAAFMLTDLADWQTFIGRQGSAFGDNDSGVYFQKTNDNYFRINFAAASGVRYVLTSDFAVEANRWYRMAATSDGSVVKLWVNDSPNDTSAWILAAETVMEPGDNRLAAVNGDWTFGRGWWGGNNVDQITGYMDDVRLSEAALEPHELLPSTPFGVPFGPMPANGQENYGVREADNTVTAVLQWNTGRDPDDSELVWDQILVHYLYLSPDQNDELINDANLYHIATIPAVTERDEYVLTGLNLDGLYLWQVEEGLDDGTGNAFAVGDPNNPIGPVWTFGARMTRPIIIEQPEDVLVDAGADVAFSIVAESISDLEYQWYRAAGPERDAESDVALTDLDAANDTFELTNAQVDDEGYYYCKVVNVGDVEQTLAVYSNVVRLGVRRLVAHWTLDAADYVDGVYLDVSGEGNPAEPNDVPTFVDGQLGDAVQISRVSGAPPTTGSWARAGTWDPSEFSGQLTVSFWLRWTGINGTYQSFVAKRSGDWNNESVLWQISTNSNATRLHLESPRGNVGFDGALDGAQGQWSYVVATFDGSTANVYLNGEQRASGDFQFGDAVDSMINLGGNSFDNGPREWMNGDLDDVQIYNYVLEEMEIALKFADEAPGRSACVQSLRPDPMFDLNDDCIVNIKDFAIFASSWLECGVVPDCLP